jgi:hypothetical protein
MVTESATSVVVFTMDIIGNGTANRHELSAGSDGQEPAVGDGNIQNLRQCYPSFNDNAACLPVSLYESIHQACLNHLITGRQATVAITTAISVW